LRALLAFVVAAGTLGGWALAARSEDLSFEAARTALLAKSDKLKAAEANINRQEFDLRSMMVSTLLGRCRITTSGRPRVGSPLMANAGIGKEACPRPPARAWSPRRPRPPESATTSVRSRPLPPPIDA
jgi:hypothetical protein